MSSESKVLHPEIWDYLILLYKKESLPSSLLFIGPQGVGKYNLSLEFAKLLLCEYQNTYPCGRCSDCLLVEKNMHPDLFVIDQLYKNISIDVSREIIKRTNLRPFRGRRKIFIIRDASNLTPEAGNSLLKILEEPPLNCLFILITSKEHLILPTIISRCWRIYFPFIRKDLLYRYITARLPSSKIEKIFSISRGQIERADKFLNNSYISKMRKYIRELVFNKNPKIFFSDREEFCELVQFCIEITRDALFMKLGLKKFLILNTYFEFEILNLSSCFPKDKLFGIISKLYTLLEAGEDLNLKLGLMLLSDLLLCRK